MGRPREFDEDEVLQKSLEVFWTRGFEGASIDDLVKATGVGRASLYSAFGDKAGIYAATLERYLAQGACALTLLEGPSPRKALRAYFEKGIETGCAKQGPRGCFAQQASMEDLQDDVAKNLVRKNSEQVVLALEAVIKRGQDAGEFTKRQSARELARFLYVMRLGAASAARVGQSPKELRAALESALAALEP